MVFNITFSLLELVNIESGGGIKIPVQLIMKLTRCKAMKIKASLSKLNVHSVTDEL